MECVVLPVFELSLSLSHEQCSTWEDAAAAAAPAPVLLETLQTFYELKNPTLTPLHENAFKHSIRTYQSPKTLVLAGIYASLIDMHRFLLIVF